MKFYFEAKRPDGEVNPEHELKLETVTRRHVEHVVNNLCLGSKAKAAKILGVNRRTLQRYQKKATASRRRASYNARREATMAEKKKSTVAGKTSAKPTKKKAAAPHGRKLDGTPKKKPGKPAAK